jgi:hypothetical protein
VADWDADLDELRWHWGEAYLIDLVGSRWMAQRRDSHATMSADGPDELLGKIREDYRRHRSAGASRGPTDRSRWIAGSGPRAERTRGYQTRGRRAAAVAARTDGQRAEGRAEGRRHRAGTPRIARVGPSSLNGASHPALRADAPAARTVDPGVSADPAGLTARARPEARPETHAANLRGRR